jgi:hypothetical protein
MQGGEKRVERENGWKKKKGEFGKNKMTVKKRQEKERKKKKEDEGGGRQWRKRTRKWNLIMCLSLCVYSL